MEKHISDIRYYNNRSKDGFIILQNVDTSKGLPVSSMLNSDATLAIPYGPQIINAINYRDRFFEVIYAEEQTNDKEKAILYLTEKSLLSSQTATIHCMKAIKTSTISRLRKNGIFIFPVPLTASIWSKIVFL